MIDKYKEKLQIWKEEELSPLQIQHLFKIDNFDKKLVLSICPQTENEKTEYFKWLVDYLNNIIYDKFIKIFDFKLIKTEELVSNRNINQIKLLIKSKIQSKNVYKNHKIFKKDKILYLKTKLLHKIIKRDNIGSPLKGDHKCVLKLKANQQKI